MLTKMKNRILVLVRLLLFLLPIFICFATELAATEMKLRDGVKGFWLQPSEQEDPDFAWQAKWIWLDEDLNYDVLLARKNFTVSEIPVEAVLRITASSKYQLYINGKYVCTGPARSVAHHQSYDIFDIASLLQKGKNILAVRVHQQEGKFSYHNKDRAGLLAQLEFAHGINSNTIITDSSWKVSNDPSWDSKSPKISRFQQVVNDRVNMRESLVGWNENEFEDAEWENAHALMRNIGWPTPQKNAVAQTLTPPWTTLVPRDIPYLVETPEHAPELIGFTKIDPKLAQQLNHNEKINPIETKTNVDNAIEKTMINQWRKNMPIEVPGSENPSSWLLLFDVGEVLNGMPMLEIEGASGMVVDILCAPYMLDNKFTHQLVDSDYRDRIILSGNKDQWEATYFKPARFIGIVIHDVRRPVKVHFVGIRKLTYPFNEIGLIQSTDAPWVEQYQKASSKTIQVCTTDAFTDNYRERRQYAQTGFYAALGNYYTFGDVALQRRYLVQIAYEQKANGIMPAYAPAASDDYMVILDSNCLWIRSLCNYLMYSGDYKTTRELLPAATNLMDLLHSYTNSLGMIDNPPYAYWLDHALIDRRGANFNLNGHYLGALEDFAQILDWISEPGNEEFQTRANLLRKSLRNYLWDEEKQLFADALIDGERSDMASEHANGIAMALKIATPEQGKSIAGQLLIDDNHNFVKRTAGLTMVTPAMSYALHKGLCDYGYVAESFELFRTRFGKMLEPDTNGTLWEEWWLDGTGRSGTFQKGKTRSDAQTESAFAPALFAEFLLGVVPTKPGMKEISLAYSASGLQNIRGAIPTPEGILEVQWNVSQNSKELSLKIPGEMKVRLDMKSLLLKEGQSIRINGQGYQHNINSESHLELSAGEYIIEI